MHLERKKRSDLIFCDNLNTFKAPSMQTTTSKLVPKPIVRENAGAEAGSSKIGDLSGKPRSAASKQTDPNAKQTQLRAVPAMSKERSALFSGIESSPHFAAETVYAAFAGIHQTT